MIFRALSHALLGAGFLLAACACGLDTNTASFTIALGGRGTLPTWQGACNLDRTRGDSLVISGTSYEARRAGQTRLVCARGDLAINVRPVERITIEGPDFVKDGYVIYRVQAYSGQDSLDLGESPIIAFSLEGPLERGEACTDMSRTCLGPAWLRVRATASGQARITASFGSHSATRRVTTSIKAP